jgi:undecaprenyl-diphosphatase
MLWRLDDPASDANYRTLALLAIATVPVAIVGFLLEKELRVLFTKPLAAAIFLTINGVILFAGERLLRSRPRHSKAVTVATLSPSRAVAIGSSQILSLLAGISRSGVTMVAGLQSGMDHEESANFAFLLATPVIFLAGLFELPKLLGSAGDGVRAQAVVGAMCAGIAAYLAVRFLTRWFRTRTLMPFAIYCLVAGLASVIRFG